MMTVAWVVLSLFVALLFLLALPISVRAEATAGDEALWGNAELRWGHSVAMMRVGSETGIRVAILGIPVYRAEAFSRRSKKKEKEKPKKEKKPSERSWRERLDSFTRDRELLYDMAARALRAFHPALYVGGRMGLADPAKTALVLVSIRELDRRLPQAVELDLWDDYLDETLQLEGRLRAWVMPLEAGLIALGWLVRSDTRRVLLGRSASPSEAVGG